MQAGLCDFVTFVVNEFRARTPAPIPNPSLRVILDRSVTPSAVLSLRTQELIAFTSH